MKIEIVSHCLGYWRPLCYQLSSLIMSPPELVDVQVTVFYTEADPQTHRALTFFKKQRLPETVKWKFWAIPETCLNRRAIGRNLAAKKSVADWIFFTDCDHLFGGGCLDKLPAALKSVQGPLAYPRSLLQTETHDDGDRVIAAIDKPTVRQMPIVSIVSKTNPAAIGGLQIVRGEVARSAGYLPDHPEFQSPAQQWQRTLEDPVYRLAIGAFNNGRGEPIDIPNLFRIRHSRCGREVAGLEL